MKQKQKKVIIGLDGVPYRLIKDFTQKGIMPETKKIVEKGILKSMESTIPEISAVAWSSIITGENPGKHGMFGFTDIPIGTYRLSFPNFMNLKCPPFWHKNESEQSVIINVPSTFPVKPLNGIHISGFVSLDLKRSVYPNSYISQLEEFNYKIDVDSTKAHTSLDIFLDELDEVLKARIKTYRYFWEEIDWDNFMIVFTGTDRLFHFLWDAYEDENHKYRSEFINHIKQIDNVIGEISQKLSENDILILLSDHGFELLEQDVNINYLLKSQKVLKLDPNSKRNYADIDESTKAFALEPSRIYLNLKNKYPKGSVDSKDAEAIIKDITYFFKDLEFNGNKVIKRVIRKEEIYKGDYINQAPDLLLLAHKGFNLKSGLKTTKPFEKGVFTGKHSQKDAVLLIGNNPHNKETIPEKPSVSDVLGIMDHLITPSS